MTEQVKTNSLDWQQYYWRDWQEDVMRDHYGHRYIGHFLFMAWSGEYDAEGRATYANGWYQPVVIEFSMPAVLTKAIKEPELHRHITEEVEFARKAILSMVREQLPPEGKYVIHDPMLEKGLGIEEIVWRLMRLTEKLYVPNEK